MIITIKSARGTDPTKAQQPLVNSEKGANFRKKDLRDGIAKKKTFRYPACKQDFFILTEDKDNG